MLANASLALMWAVVSAAIILAALNAVGVKADIITILLINSASIIVSIIPITMGGLGARETTAVLLFQRAGFAAAPVLAGYLIVTVISNVIALVITGVALLSRKN